MGQGQDKVARNLVDLQPTAIVELFLLYFDTVDNETAYIAFHGGSSFANGITWQGIEYLPLPVETEGFEITANGELPRPKIKISNKDYFITDLLNKYQDLQFAKIIRKRTFVKFLDDVNFDGGNPWGEADSSAEISNDTYLIGQKTAENKLFVELELTSPLDLENFEVNNRMVLARYCSWYYRGAGCNYDGPPIETEEGEKLIINYQSAFNWADVSVNSQWQTNLNYQKGEPVFLYNKKSSSSTLSKIWYVCKEAHFSTELLRPDLSSKYWGKDGCGKKLINCQRRFVNDEELFIHLEETGVITNHFYQTYYLNKDNYDNNIVRSATITASSKFAKDYMSGPDNIKELSYANYAVQGIPSEFVYYSDWIAADDKGTITLTWTSPQIINQINIYDSSDKTNHIRNAVIDLYNGSPTPYERIIASGIPDNNTEANTLDPRSHTGKYISFPSDKTVTSIRISGSGVIGKTSLNAVEVLKPYGFGLVFDNSVDKIHLSPFLHIGTFVEFYDGLINENETFNIFHNVEKGCDYSGLNLFAKDKDLVLQFAVAKTLKNGINYSDVFVPTELVISDFYFDFLEPLHIEIHGGGASGVDADVDNIDNEGYIKVTTLIDTFQYNLPKERDVIDINGNILYEERSYKPSYFKFKNPSYQGGISPNIFWGINNYSNVTRMSNFMLGTIAIWTGSSFTSRNAVKSAFNRTGTYDQLYNDSVIVPLTYSEATALVRNNVFAWWDMDLSDSEPYRILSSNSPQKILTLSGSYNPDMHYIESGEYNFPTTVDQTPKTFLPFGGFPGTDTYGR